MSVPGSLRVSNFIPRCLCLVTFMILCACSSAQDQQDNVILRWNTTTLQAITDTRSVPTVAARALAIVNTSIYNAWAAYDPIAMPTLRGVTLRSPEPDLSKKSVAISFAAYHALFDLLPSDTSLFDNEMESLGLDPNATSSDVLTPASIAPASQNSMNRLCSSLSIKWACARRLRPPIPRRSSPHSYGGRSST